MYLYIKNGLGFVHVNRIGLCMTGICRFLITISGESGFVHRMFGSATHFQIRIQDDFSYNIQ
jgi:hypothetical protein